MNIRHNILFTIILAHLYACSATDSGEANNNASEEDSNTEVNEAVDTRLTSELSSDPYFTFNTSHSIALDFSWSVMSNQRGYLSVCHDGTENPDGSWNIDYESCLLRTPVTDGSFEGEVEITNDHTVLFAELWSYDLSSPPLRMRFTRTSSANETWLWSQ